MKSGVSVRRVKIGRQEMKVLLPPVLLGVRSYEDGVTLFSYIRRSGK
jgi:hypothetical protein